MKTIWHSYLMNEAMNSFTTNPIFVIGNEKGAYQLFSEMVNMLYERYQQLVIRYQNVGDCDKTFQVFHFTW